MTAVEPMGDEELAAIRKDLAEREAEKWLTVRLSQAPMLIGGLQRLLARLDQEIAARKAAEADLAARIKGILDDKHECCGRPVMRDLYDYDEHGNATDIIGSEPDHCCGCPIERDPAAILAAVEAALPLPDLTIPAEEGNGHG